MSRHARHGGRPHHRGQRHHVESATPRTDRSPVDRPRPAEPRAAPVEAAFASTPLLTDQEHIDALGEAAEVPQVVADEPSVAGRTPTDGDGNTLTDGNGHTLADRNGHTPPAGCTPAQMRRFIKSRPWIPMHELRRRFGINGYEDDVTPVAVGPRTLFVGLPQREGRMLGDLLRGGDVGYELSIDPDTPVVIGVFPMRPVART